MPQADPIEGARQRRISPVSRGDRVKRLLWSMVEMTLYRCSFHTWSGWRAFLLRRFGARIGRECTIRRTSRVYYPWKLEMGDMSCLGDAAQVYNLGPVTLGKRATLSQEAYICAGTHDYTQITMPLVTLPITKTRPTAGTRISSPPSSTKFASGSAFSSSAFTDTRLVNGA